MTAKSLKFEEALAAMRRGEIAECGMYRWRINKSLQFQRGGEWHSGTPSNSDMTSADWSIVREPMDFMTAFKAMEERKRVQRAGWGSKAFIGLHNHHFNSSIDSSFKLDAFDIRATDWQIVED